MKRRLLGLLIIILSFICIFAFALTSCKEKIVIPDEPVVPEKVIQGVSVSYADTNKYQKRAYSKYDFCQQRRFL